jgi:hypothetical protein
MAKKMPVNDGDIAAPTEREILVTPDAAERSSGDTTAIVYDWRVGTSICEMLNRSSNTATANGSVGMSGTRISNTFDGMCVKTIVLIKPILLASLTASKAEIPANIFAPKKIEPMMPASIPNLIWNQYAIMACTGLNRAVSPELADRAPPASAP